MAAINVDKMDLKDLVSLEGKLKSAIAEARARERSDLKKKVAALAEFSRLLGQRIVWCCS